MYVVVWSTLRGVACIPYTKRAVGMNSELLMLLYATVELALNVVFLISVLLIYGEQLFEFCKRNLLPFVYIHFDV